MKKLIILCLFAITINAYEYKNPMLKNVEMAVKQDYKDCIASKKLKKAECDLKMSKELKGLLALDSKNDIKIKKRENKSSSEKKKQLKTKSVLNVKKIKTNPDIDNCLANSKSMEESKACLKM
jgi:hypothetical protein